MMLRSTAFAAVETTSLTRRVSGRRAAALPCTARAGRPSHTPLQPCAPTPRHPLPAPLRSASSDPALEEEPDTAREAIQLGNKFAKLGRWSEALVVYEKALTLPGTGLKRYRDKPRQISDGERSAALFNIACCQAQLGDMRAGLVALVGCLELGYDDFAQLRSDPDLEPLRKDERFEGLLKRFERPANPLGGFIGSLFGGGKK